MSRTAARARSATGRLAVVLAMVIAGSPVARAAADETDDPPAAPRATWYGWETLLSDASAHALWAAAIAVDDAKYTSGARQSYQTWAHVLVGAGFVVYGLGAPVVHLANGHPGKAAGSLGLRLALPVAGALAGLLFGRATCGSGGEGDVPCEAIGGLFGFFGGGVAAIAIDAAVLARGPAEPATGSRLQAAFVPTGSGGTFVLGGRF